MRLTTFSDYTLRVLMYLGLRGTELSTIAEIADAYGISKNHLMKVVNQLATWGYVETIRGKNGGLRLHGNPANINIGEVVRNSEKGSALVECFQSSGDCRIEPVCRLRGALGKATEAFYKALDEYSLADLLKNRDEISPILVPAPGAGARPPDVASG